MMLRFFNKTFKAKILPEAEATELGKRLFLDLQKEIKRDCREQLFLIKSLVDNDKIWDDAERSDNLAGVLARYCGAIDGTEETACNIFKKFEIKAQNLGIKSLVEYIQTCKLEHLLKLRRCFEYKLKISLAPVGIEREKIRSMVADIINLEFS